MTPNRLVDTQVYLQTLWEETTMKMKVMTTWLVISGFSIGTATFLPTRSALAQVGSPQSLQPLAGSEQDQTDLDFFSDSSSGSGADLLNLINQVRLMQGWSPAQYAAEQAGNLDAAAAEFRARQLQQIQTQQQPNNPSSPVDLAPAP